MVFFGYSLARAPYVQMGVVDAEGQLVHSFDPGVTVPSMMHDFAITDKYSILMDLPLRFDPKRGPQGKAMLQFDPTAESRFAIFSRHCTSQEDIKWFTAPPCYVFHTANAWEHDNKVAHGAFLESFQLLLKLNCK